MILTSPAASLLSSVLLSLFFFKPYWAAFHPKAKRDKPVWEAVFFFFLFCDPGHER